MANTPSEQQEFPGKQMAIMFADIVAQQVKTDKNKIKNPDIRVLEHLIFSRNFIQNKLDHGQIHYKEFGNRKVSINFLQKTLIYTNKKVYINLKEDDENYLWYIKRGENKLQEYSVAKSSLSESYTKTVLQKLYKQISDSNGLSPLLELEGEKLDPLIETLLEDQEIGASFFEIHEKKLTDKGLNDTKWQYIPIKILSAPIIKVMYELPQALSSALTESVVQSPLDNLRSTGEEFTKALKSIPFNFKEMGRGIANPKRGGFIEGTLGFLDTGMSLVKTGLGVAKTCLGN
jgi:hypothetical protein